MKAEYKSANPTMKTQEKVLGIIKHSKNPLSISEISIRSNLSFYQVRTSVSYLKSLGIVKTIVSSGNVTLVQLNKSIIQCSR